jgi:Fic family protein
LPPDIDLSLIIDEFGRASAALGGLKEIGTTIVNPYMVIRPLQRNEALRSSAMEGTYSTADDLAIVEAMDAATGSGADLEVYNYIRAIDYGIRLIEEYPISHRVIRGMHETLLSRAAKARGANKRPGDYKIHQNWIGALSIKNARFIPPPPSEALACMDDLEAYINADDQGVPPLIAAGLTHYQFETIHPFGDGNGRVGRMLITLQLLSHGLLDTPLLYVSPAIEDSKDEYIDSMFEVSCAGNWIRWLRYFLNVVETSCASTVATITRLNNLQASYRNRIQTETKSISAIRIADHLFERPVLSISDAARISGTSYQSSKKAIEQLIRLKIVLPVPDYENPRLFWSKDIIDISDGRLV